MDRKDFDKRVKKEPVPAVKKQESGPIEPKDDSVPGRCSSSVRHERPWMVKKEPVPAVKKQASGPIEPKEKGSAGDTVSGSKTGSLSGGGMGRPKSSSGEALLVAKNDIDAIEEKRTELVGPGDRLLIRFRYKGSVRAMVVPKSHSFSDVKALVERNLEIGAGSAVMFWKPDDDDDWCDLVSDSDWEAFMYKWECTRLEKDSESPEISLMIRNE